MRFLFLTLSLFISLSILRAQDDSIYEDNQIDSIYVDEIEEVSPVVETSDSTFVEITLPDYEPWQRVKIDGKLKRQGLPLSPSLKIFMEKDSLIDISIRAPFVGEAGHIVISQDSILAVNKMNKTYTKESISEFLQFYPGGFSNVQDLLLARFFLPGIDLEEADLESLVDIYFEEGQFNVVPKGMAEIEGVTYGYIVDDFFRPLWLVVMPENRPDLEFDVVYSYTASLLPGKSPYTIKLILQNGSQAKEATLELKAPEWEGEAPKDFEVNKKFRQLSFGDFLKSF